MVSLDFIPLVDPGLAEPGIPAWFSTLFGIFPVVVVAGIV